MVVLVYSMVVFGYVDDLVSMLVMFWVYLLLWGLGIG